MPSASAAQDCSAPCARACRVRPTADGMLGLENLASHQQLVHWGMRQGMQDVRHQAAQAAGHWMCGSAERVRGWQVYRAVRLGVQDVAVKLLTKVDTAQLDVFIEVGLCCLRGPSCLSTAL